jgi:hypothetical protein
MTRERAIEVLKAWDLNCSDEFTTNEFEQAFAMAIKALEQEPILNKIRAEINQQEKWLLQAGYTAYNVDIAFDTINAVLAESENKKCI